MRFNTRRLLVECCLLAQLLPPAGGLLPSSANPPHKITRVPRIVRFRPIPAIDRWPKLALE